MMKSLHFCMCVCLHGIADINFNLSLPQILLTMIAYVHSNLMIFLHVLTMYDAVLRYQSGRFVRPVILQSKFHIAQNNRP